MNAIDVPVPERLKRLPLYKGYLVHFTVWVDAEGVPDFRVVHENNRRRCMEEDLCALCGKPLEKPMVFIGGPWCLEDRIFLDGPMHEDCALYAARTCPYLADADYRDRPVDSSVAKLAKDEAAVAIACQQSKPGRPARMMLCYVNSYSLLLDQTPIMYKAGYPVKIDWDAMPKR